MRFSTRASSGSAILLLMLILVFTLFVQFLIANIDNPVPTTPTYEDVNAVETDNNIFERRTNGSATDSYSEDDDVYYTYNATWRDYLFYIFRFGLFLFIICFPCIRGIRVWYAAGGRIRFRRTGGVDQDGNSRGWIIGLRYQAADLDRWLILSGYGHQVNGPNGAPGAPGGPERKLTPEEVYALPEIKFSEEPIADKTTAAATTTSGDIELGSVDELAATYHGIGNSGSDSENKINSTIHNSNHNNNNNTDNPSDAIRLSAITESEPGSATTSTADSSRAEATDSPTESSPSSSEETAAPSENATATTARTKYPTLFTTTMSTACSICIDDFEEGEKIRLLPHCGHAFHTECILPWLTERQGCCPCCKAAVICPPASADENEIKDNETDENDTNRNDNRISESGIWW